MDSAAERAMSFAEVMVDIISRNRKDFNRMIKRDNARSTEGQNYVINLCARIKNRPAFARRPVDFMLCEAS